MPEKHPKRPRDFSQAAEVVIDIATGEKLNRDPTPEEEGKARGAAALVPGITNTGYRGQSCYVTQVTGHFGHGP